MLTAGQSAWADPYASNAVWRFQNANGYERTYKIVKAYNSTLGGGGGRNSFCPSYYQHYRRAIFHRTDSTDTSYLYELSLSAPTSSSAKLNASLTWGQASFPLPIDEVEAGSRMLGPATFNGRTFPAVLASTYTPQPPEIPRAQMLTRIYITKGEGIIRFEEYGGQVWNRVL